MSQERKRFPARPCPVCRGLQVKLLYRQRFEQLSGVRLLDGYDVVICRDCGAGFADDVPPQAVFDDYYRCLLYTSGGGHGGRVCHKPLLAPADASRSSISRTASP